MSEIVVLKVTKTPEQEAYLAGVAAAAEQITELRAENKALRNEQATLEHTNRRQADEIRRLREERDSFERRVVDYVHALGESRAEMERLRARLQDALHAIDWMMNAQQPLSDAWFEQRDRWIASARDAC